MKILFCFMLCVAMIAVSRISTAQVEFTEISDPVYQFLKEMQISGFLTEYNSSALPVSRKTIAGYLKELDEKSSLTKSERSRLKYFMDDYEYEITGTTKNQNRLVSGPFQIRDDRQSHLYYYTDSSVTFFAGIDGSFYFRNNSGDPDSKNDMFYGNGGVSARATLFQTVGVKLYASAIYGFRSGSNSLKYVPYFFPESVGKDGYRNRKTSAPGAIAEANSGESVPQPKDTVFSPYQGYVRYATSNEWFSLLLGRSASSFGFGYIDKLFLSDNAAPYDKGELELRYKSVKYRFSYGSVYGDSVGIYNSSAPYPVNKRDLSSKNIASHYLGIDFSKAFRLGLWESVVISEQPFSFTYFNPISFLTSADLSSGDESTTQNNALLGIETEIIPAKNVSFQASLLIDDLTFETLFEDDSLNENKFGWQFGAMWTALPGISLSLEYTHLDPFVYSHRSNKSTYTNRGNSMGHSLPPNSDEIALQLRYNPSPAVSANLTYKHQRSAEGILLNDKGELAANYGGYISYGLGDAYLRTNNFLDGNRINRDYVLINASYQFSRQFYLQARLEYRHTDNVYEDKAYDDFLIDIGLKIDLR